MRKKAENIIRQAAAQLGGSMPYRIDQVRQRAGMIRKVFDKTLLDMARVGTIMLSGGNTSHMSAADIGELLREGDRLHVYFKFLEAPQDQAGSEGAGPTAVTDPEPAKIDSMPVEVVLFEIEIKEWQQFEVRCRRRENKAPLDKLIEMIKAYNQEQGGL